MKIFRGDPEKQDNEDPASEARKYTKDTADSVEMLMTLFDKLCPTVFLHVTAINARGGGVSMSRVADMLPDNLKEGLEKLNLHFSSELAALLGGETSGEVHKGENANEAVKAAFKSD